MKKRDFGARISSSGNHDDDVGDDDEVLGEDEMTRDEMR